MLRQADRITGITREEVSTLDGLLFGAERLVDALEATLAGEQGPPLRQRLDAMRRDLERLVDTMQLELLVQHERRKRDSSRFTVRQTWTERRLLQSRLRDASRSSLSARAAAVASGFAERVAAVSA
jgi:hypothetical protein